MGDMRLVADAVDDYGKALVREVLADLRANVEVLRAYAVDIKLEWKDPEQAERAVLLRDVLRLIDEIQHVG